MLSECNVPGTMGALGKDLQMGKGREALTVVVSWGCE